MTMSNNTHETPLPARDLNQELGKTCGAAHALELALTALCHNEHLVTDRDDPSVRGVCALAQVLADRLDDLQVMMGGAEEFTRRQVAAACARVG
jgi:hypothetical protein